MPIIEALLFGLVQGLTEFLPVSSTAHIVITELVLGYHFPGLAFEIFLHQASVLAVLVFFRRELWQIISGFFSYLRLRDEKDRGPFFFAIYIVVATIITGVLGLALKNLVLEVMKTPPFLAATLVVTGSFLVFIERFREYGQRTAEDMNISDALIIGLAQTVAVLPGISRSGATVVAGLWRGLGRETAVRYSFLLAIPVILGSSILAVDELSFAMGAALGPAALAVSFLSTLFFSWVGIVWLINALKKGRLLYFAIYCYLVALLVFMLL